LSPSSLIDEAVRRAAPGLAGWPDSALVLPTVVVERTANPAHGDYSVTLPLKLAARLQRQPLDIASELAERIVLPERFAMVTVAPPGFINLRLESTWLQSQIHPIVKAGAGWGSCNLGRGMRVQVEFVSSNPTGPLLFSHGRGAVVGDVVARVLEATGYSVQREYYVNDAGNQVRLFAESIRARMLGLPVPEGGYAGDYVNEIASAARGELGPSPTLEQLADFGVAAGLAMHREDLARLDVRHDNWFSERSLYSGWDQETMQKLRAQGRVAERDGAVWFITGTDKDEVLYKRTGDPTYFAADVFYHRDKFERRGLERVIDVLGADHHGNLLPLKRALETLGIDPARLIIVVVQFVSIRKGAEAMRMSRRAGVGVSLKDMLDEVGPDAVRYFFLMRSADMHMEFDVDLAKKQSDENPVFYAQYAHARLSNVLKFGAGVIGEPELARLNSEWELELLRTMLRWPDVVCEAANAREPHRLAHFTHDLSAKVHVFYKNCRVVTEDIPLTAARLQLCRAARITLANALRLMGVRAPERM